MKVFVTGGTGLVGSHVIQLLCDRGHSVRALVRQNHGKALVEGFGATAVFGSIEDPDTWSHAQGTDAIVHSAAIVATRQQWSSYQELNVNGARNAAHAAAKLGTPLVHISSVAVYGRGRQAAHKKIAETTAFVDLPATDYYARSKRKAEATIDSVVKETGLPAVCLRPCVVYGERDRTFLPHVIRILARGFAPVVGPGSNTIAVVYAGNVAEAVMASLEHPDVTGPFNVTNDGVVTQREFLDAVGGALGKQVRLVRIPVPVAYVFAAARNITRRVLAPRKYPGFGASAVTFLASDNPYTSERAHRELGWKPTTPPDEAIYRSIRWFVDSR